MPEATTNSAAEAAVLAAAQALMKSNMIARIVSTSGLAASGVAASVVGLSSTVFSSLTALSSSFVFPFVALAAVGAAVGNKARQRNKRESLEDLLAQHQEQIGPEVLEAALRVLRESSGDIKATSSSGESGARSSAQSPANPGNRANG